MIINTLDDLELYILGGLLNGKQDYAYRLIEADFTNESRRKIFRIINRKIRNNEVIDINIALEPDLDEQTATVFTAIRKYLDEDNYLYEGQREGIEFERRVAELIQTSDIKFAQEGCREIARKISNKQIPTVSKASSEISLLQDTLYARHKCSTDVTVEESVRQALINVERNRGKKKFGFGLPSLDKFLYGGLTRPEYVILAARTNVGKSILSMLPALTAASAGETVLWCTNEMTCEQMALRMLANRSGVSMGVLEGHILGLAEEYDRIEQARAEMAKMDLIMLAECYYISQIEDALKRRQQAGRPVTLVVVDLIGRMKSETKGVNKKYDIVTENSNRMSSISKMYDCTILAVSQISRAGALADHISLEHLKDSGALEEDSDKVFLMWGDKDNPDWRHLYLAKNRSGPKDADFILSMIGETMQFYEVQG